MDSSQSASRPPKEASSPDSDSNQSASVAPEKKRRASRAGTRSVSQLTPAQLDRKRANDREAQRAIRQRQKDRIEGLEKRIKDLEQSGGDNQQQLLNALKANKELEEENDHLRKHIEQQSLSLPGHSGENPSSTPWEDLAIRGQSPLRLATGLPIGGPQGASPSLMSPRDAQSVQQNYGTRQVPQWQSSNPFGEPLSQSKSESPASSESQLGQNQYSQWTAAGGDQTRVPSHGEPRRMSTQQIDYTGLSSNSSSHPTQPLSYHALPSNATSGQPAMPLSLSQQNIAQYGPIHQPYMQHQPPPQQYSQQQHPPPPPPPIRGSSRTSPSQSPHDSHAMYYSNYPPPS